MKSVKPGRGPSAMSGVMSLLVGAFGVFWTIAAVSMGAGMMAPFGVIIIIIAVVQGVYHLKNARAKNRHSSFDITDEDEEPDPLNERFHTRIQGLQNPAVPGAGAGAQQNFCPYCGAGTESNHVFCKNCGKNMQ